ncbi:hypothetical protein [Thiomicrorhabdus sp.]|uniref:hypothetical protein n=1 Tax=Thiomicrorhabdus sp. TaxID=2039724 RepID=UPI00356A27F7
MSASQEEHNKPALAYHKILPPKPELCDHPSYLFWKVQSQLVKLNHRLNRTVQNKKETTDPTTSK